jgi:hypothetical protein
MDWIIMVSRWLHIAAVVLAIGGAAYVRFALLPGMREALDESAQEKLRSALRRRWARLVHASIAVLLITGSFNFVMLAMPPAVHPIPYHPIFGLKFLAALAIFAMASVLVGRSPNFEALRRQSAKWLNLILMLAVVIILLSGFLNKIRVAQAVDNARSEVVQTTE